MCQESFLKVKKYIFMKQVFFCLLFNYPHICTQGLAKPSQNSKIGSQFSEAL